MKKLSDNSLLFLIIFIPLILTMIVGLSIRLPLNTVIMPEITNSFLGTIAQVDAGILAIIFSLSILAVEISADKYSARLLSLYTYNRVTLITFVIIALPILISVIAIGVQSIPMYQSGFLIMVLLFLLSFAILPCYIQSTLQLLDPRTLAELISSEGINAFRKNEKQKVIERIEALGDLAIKALDRSEEEFVINFLNSLQDLQDNLISGDWSVLNRDSSDNVLFLFDNGISSPIVDQYNRIFRRAVAKKQESISIRIAHLTSLSVDTCLNWEGSKKQLIGILRQFRELFREAVDKKDESRFIMVLQMHNFLFTRVLSSFFLADYLPHCLSLLRDMNKIILDCADFDLWKKVLDHFSAITSVNQLSVQLQHIFLNRLNNIGVRVSQEELNLLEIIQTRLTSGNQQLLEFYLERRRGAEVEEDLNKLWLTTCIFDVFFEICVYACYHKKYQYIHELWRHTNPPDASAYWCNTNLIQFHPGFLLYQSVSELTLPWDIESYHGASAYISKYFLYSLAYALSKFHCDWHPALPIANWQELQTNSQYSRVIGIALRDLYIYLINLPTHVDVVLSHFDTAMDDKQEWEGIFDGNASVALELARNWLTEEDRQQEWKTTAESILINLPLFQDYVQVYQQNAIEEYHSQSILNELAIISTGTSRKRGQKLTGRNIIKRIDKTEFTLINIAKPEELVNRVGYEAIGQIVNAETNFVIQKWLSRKGKTYITVKNLTYKVIAEATKEIHKTGHEATVIIVPWQQYAKAWREDPDIRRFTKHEGNDRFIKIGEISYLRVIENDGDDVVILDKSASDWTYIQPPSVEIIEDRSNPLYVQIQAEEIVDFQIRKPTGAELLRLSILRKKIHPYFE